MNRVYENGRTCVSIHINGEEYQHCVEWSENACGGKKEAGTWNDGMIGRYNALRVGKLGEIALSKVLDAKVDWDVTRFDPGFDFSANGDRFEVKTSSKSFYNQLLIRTDKIDKADVFVAAKMQYESDDCADVVIVGYMRRNDIKKHGSIEDGYHGNWKNYMVLFEDTKPLDRLFEFFQGEPL